MESLNLPNSFYLNASPSLEKISLLAENLSQSNHLDYFDFLKAHDGGEGELGEGYLSLWSVDEMIEVNHLLSLENPKFTEKYWLFASNSGVFQYAFEKNSARIIEIDPYDESYEIEMGHHFFEFLQHFATKPL